MLHSMSVKDYMSANVITFSPNMGILEAIHQMIKHGIAGGPVVDNLGNLVGFLSEKDCLKVALTASYHEEPGGKVKEFMTPKVETVDASASLIDVIERFVDTNIRRFPVVEDSNRVVGQISRSDALRALEKIW
jgi:CBS domain-containing protein